MQIYLFVQFEAKSQIYYYSFCQIACMCFCHSMWFMAQNCVMLWTKEGRPKLNSGTVNCTTMSFSLCCELKSNIYWKKDKKKELGFRILFIKFSGKTPTYLLYMQVFACANSRDVVGTLKLCAVIWLDIMSWILP